MYANVMGITTPVLVIVLTSEILLGLEYCFWFTFFFFFFKVEVVLVVSLWTFSPNSTHSSDQRTNMEILPIDEYIYSNYAFWNWENNCRMGSGTHWEHYEMDLG